MLALDTNYPEIDHENFKKNKWVEFYGEVKEVIPTDMPDPRWKNVDLGMQVDNDHARDTATRQSQTGLIIFTNAAFIQWMYKKQMRHPLIVYSLCR